FWPLRAIDAVGGLLAAQLRRGGAGADATRHARSIAGARDGWLLPVLLFGLVAADGEHDAFGVGGGNRPIGDVVVMDEEDALLHHEVVAGGFLYGAHFLAVSAKDRRGGNDVALAPGW